MKLVLTLAFLAIVAAGCVSNPRAPNQDAIISDRLTHPKPSGR